MPKKLLYLLTTGMLFFCTSGFYAIPDSDRVCGKWQSAEKNLIVQVYKDGEDFRAKIVWFNDKDDPSRPMDTRLDSKNPQPALRTRKIVGMDVLEDMVYVAKSDSWENGKIYDALSGRTWSSAAYINPQGQLKVTGYWHFKWIGRTITFNRI